MTYPASPCSAWPFVLPGSPTSPRLLFNPGDSHGFLPVRAHLLVELIDLRAQFTHQFVVAGLQVGQPLRAMGFLGFGRGVRRGQLGVDTD